MPSVNDLKKSFFLKKEDCGAGILVTISKYELINVAKQGEAEDMKYVLHFHETDKPMVLNSTNGQLIERITGSDQFADWIEKKVVLYSEPNVTYGGKLLGGIRVRAPRGQAAATAKPQAQPPRRPTAAQEANLEEGPGEEVPF